VYTGAAGRTVGRAHRVDLTTNEARPLCDGRRGEPQRAPVSILILLRILAFVLGALLVIRAVSSAIVSFVLPRSAPDRITQVVFRVARRIFDLRNRSSRTYEERDRVMALYAPVSLLTLPAVWLTLVLLGYMAMFWALGLNPGDALRASGSSLLTLGFAEVETEPGAVLGFTEAALGLFFVSILIAYLPTMYGAFSRRETAVTMLDVRAGTPPSAVEMLARYNRIHGYDRLSEVWASWELWFVELEETHTSLAALAFFRSPIPGRSWITAAGAVLDAAALAASTVDLPHDPQTDLCIRAGFLALRRICDFFGIPYDPAPKPGDPISVARVEFDAACEELAANGVPLKADLDQAWIAFAGWRVNYDTVLLELASLTMAPYARWSSDRGLRSQRPPHAPASRRRGVRLRR
jgi:hypothetical protein